MSILNNNILLKVNRLEYKINKLEIKIDKILNILEENSKDCKKMSSHIDFIDGVYENIKAPMNYICNGINKNLIKN